MSTPAGGTGNGEDLQALSQDRDGLAEEIARGREELAAAARAVGAGGHGHAPAERTRLLREYGPLVLPIALLVVMNPVRTARLVGAAWRIWQGFRAGVASGQHLHEMAQSIGRRTP